MSLLSRVSPLGGEIGLQVLLAAGTSSAVVRFANVAVGVALPVYQSIKSLEDRFQPYQRKWLGYWSVYGCLHASEALLRPILRWVPLYEHMKLAFLVWLQWPPDYGFVKVYCRYVRPLFHRFRPQVDPALQAASQQLAAWESAHRSELRAAGKFLRHAFSKVVSVVRAGVAALQRHGPVPSSEGAGGTPLMEQYLAPPHVVGATDQGQAPGQPRGTSMMGVGSTASAGAANSGRGQGAGGQGQMGREQTGGGAMQGQGLSGDAAGWVHVLPDSTSDS